MIRLLLWSLAAAVIVALGGCGGGEEDNFPALTPFDPGLADRLHGIRDRISEIRGLPAYQLVVEGAVSQDALQQYVAKEAEASSEDDKAKLEAFGVVLKMLKLIPPDQDLKQLLTQDYPSQILGLYFPGKDRLALVTTDQEIGTLDELVLAHEYTHSLQDGSFDIKKLRKIAKDSNLEKDGYTQYSETLDCLIEGDATYAARLYAEKVFGSDWTKKVAEDAAQGGETERPTLPPFLQRAVSFNYGECANFVQQLYKDGGWEAVNNAYADPPATTEQILHLDKYKSRELANTGPPADLSEELKGWALLDSSQFGEFDVFDYAATLTGDPLAASIAAKGWGAGWSRVYQDKADANRAVVQLSLGWDTQDDLLQFLAVYGMILRAIKASVQPVGDQGDARWTAEGQFGALALDKDRARVDIRIATDADALTLATKDLPAFH